jgi:uncharacterized protein (TIGR02246 family)
MRRILTAALVTIVGFSLSVDQTAAQALKAEDAIAQTISDYASAWNNADAKAIAELFTTDADDAVIGSVAQIEQRYTQMFNETARGTQLVVATSALRFLTPAVAVIDGSFQLDGVLSGGGQNQVRRLFVAVIVNDNSQWRITSLWSAPVNPPDSND